MFAKTSHTLTGMLLFVSVSAFSLAPVKANPLNEPAKAPILISQLCGHEVYKGEPQMQLSEYMIGKVVGRSGDISTIVLPDGTVLNQVVPMYNFSGLFTEGSNVRVMKDSEGNYTVVGLAHPYWMTDLVEQKGLKLASAENCSTRITVSSFGETRTVGLAPLAPAQPVEPVEVAPEPVRGMW